MIQLRFVSKYRQYEHKGIDRVDQEIHWQTGKEKHRGIMCRFQHADLSPWEIEAGLKYFKFGGLGHDENPAKRLSAFDTELQQRQQGWSDEDREKVERRLLSSPSYGTDFIKVDRPEPKLPYRAYAKHRVVKGRRTVEHVVADVQQAIEIAGVDLEAVIAYEREVGDNPALIEALVKLTPEPDDEPLIAA